MQPFQLNCEPLGLHEVEGSQQVRILTAKASEEVFLYWLQTICTRASALFTFWFRLPWYNPAIQNPKGKYFNTDSLQFLNCHKTQMKLVGLICPRCALMQLWFGWSRTGYESIRQGWDHARNQGNQLVRGAWTAIFSFRFSSFLMLVTCDT